MAQSQKYSILANLLGTPFLRYILLGAFVTTVVFPIYSLFFVYPSFTKLLIQSTEEDAVRTGSHLAHMFFPENSELTSDHFSKTSIEEIERMIEDFKLEQLKIFAKSGLVVYSSDPKDIGTINRKDYFRKMVATGHIYTNVVQRNTRTLEGRIVRYDVVETYVPVMRNNSFIGAFEIYYEITGREERLAGLWKRSIMTLLALASILLTAIVAILFKASHAMIERRKAEETLRDSEFKFRTIVTTAKDAIILTDGEENISYWNPAAEKIFGYASEEIVGKGLRSLLFPEKHFEDLDQELGDIKKSGQHQAKTIELTASRKNNTNFPVEIVLSPIRIQGEWCALAVIRDVSEQKSAEQERLERGKLEGVVEMAGAVCHELNQPMQGILGLTDLLSDEISEGNPGEYLKKIREKIDQMRTITEKLMRITRYATRDYSGGIKIIDIDRATK